MSDIADRHRRIVDVVEPLERMGVDASVDEHTTDDGDLRLTLDLRVPPALDSIDGGEAVERDDVLKAQCERLRAQRDEARERANEVLRWAGDLEDRVTDMEALDEGSGSDGEADTDDERGEPPAVAQDHLTDGERETLQALRALGDRSASREIADDVDGTLQSVRSWLTKLVQEGHIRAQPDPSDGRRKLYSPVDRDGRTYDEHSDDERVDEKSDDGQADEEFDDGRTHGEHSDDERADDEQFGGADGTVHIASNGGSPSQVFHVRADCPQLKKSADSVEKDRSVVPHHRPCANCVPDGLEEGLVAIAKGSETATYHKREDCPKLGAANDVAVQARESVPNYDPCDDCVRLDEEANTDEEEADSPTAAHICARNDLRPEAVVEALDGATAIYHVQRELTLSRDETEALLQNLGVFENLHGGGRVTPERAKSVALEHLPPAKQLGSDGGNSRD